MALRFRKQFLFIRETCFILFASFEREEAVNRRKCRCELQIIDDKGRRPKKHAGNNKTVSTNAMPG